MDGTAVYSPGLYVASIIDRVSGAWKHAYMRIVWVKIYESFFVEIPSIVEIYMYAIYVAAERGFI